MILKAYVDDSDVNQRPFSVLGGWIAPALSWASFSEEWERALRMKPILQYFKMSEAMSLGGEFLGWSEESRNHRLRHLVKLIEEYRMLAIGTAIYTDDYREIFRDSPLKTFDVPYFLMFYGMIAGLVTEFSDLGQLQRAREALDNASRLGVPVEIWGEE